jgi:mono/diheme cytochrome c family protein
MKKLIKIPIMLVASLTLVSCFQKDKPNYQYFPNMYVSPSYETYGEYDVFPNQIEAMTPPENTIPRGWKPFDYQNTNEDRMRAKEELKNPMPITQENLDNGKKMFDLYCAICHGPKGDGQGTLVKREKFLGVPSYADRDITEGSIYYTMMYGLNTMGSHASQTNEKERWQITMYVQKLRATLKGEEFPLDQKLTAPANNDEQENLADTQH